MAFCPNCGKTTTTGFCQECEPLEDIKSRDITLIICVECDGFFYRNKWPKRKSMAEAMAKVASACIKGNVDEVRSDIEDIKKKPGGKEAVMIEVVRDGLVFEMPAIIEFSYCPVCSKLQGQYYEGTLQIRDADEEILKFIEKFVKEHNISIASNSISGNRQDLDISDQRQLQALGKQLFKNFGGSVKTSIRQFTQNRLTSKQVYRINVLYEAPLFKRGSVIKAGKSIVLVTNVRKIISGIDLRNDKKIAISGKDYEILPILKTTISKIYPNIEVLDPETFQSVPILNKKDVALGEKVKVVNDNGIFYIV